MEVIECEEVQSPKCWQENSEYVVYANNEQFVLEQDTEMKDLGVLVDSQLKFKNHIYTIIGKAYRMLGIIKHNFSNINRSTFVILYKSFIKSCLDTSTCVWSPHSKGLIFELEKVQKRATKILAECKSMSYEQRLKYLKLPTLVYRRLHGDMIKTFKILNNFYARQHSCSAY